MKVFILFISLILSHLSFASSTAAIMAAAATQAYNYNNVNVRKTETEVSINVIKKSLPNLCSPQTSIYGSCWSQFDKETLNYKVNKDEAKTIYNYFYGEGYKVKVNEDNLTFDFKEEHIKYLAHSSLPYSSESAAISLVLFLFISIIFVILARNHLRHKKIKKIYFANPDLLDFNDQFDRTTFEKEIRKERLPPDWIVHLAGDRISMITRMTSYSFGIVAVDREARIKKLTEMFKPNTKKLEKD